MRRSCPCCGVESTASPTKSLRAANSPGSTDRGVRSGHECRRGNVIRDNRACSDHGIAPIRTPGRMAAQAPIQTLSATSIGSTVTWSFRSAGSTGCPAVTKVTFRPSAPDSRHAREPPADREKSTRPGIRGSGPSALATRSARGTARSARSHRCRWATESPQLPPSFALV
jgi:hypothetical protein